MFRRAGHSFLLFKIVIEVYRRPLWNGQQPIHILLDGLVFLGFGSCGFVFSKEPFLFCVEIGKLRFHAFRCRQRHSPQPFQFSGGCLKKNDLALMASQELFLIAGFTVAVIERFQLAIGGSVLHHKGKLCGTVFYLLDLRMSGIPAFRHGVHLAFQFLIAADTMLRQKVQSPGRASPLTVSYTLCKISSFSTRFEK